MKRAHTTLASACIAAVLCIAAVAAVIMFAGSESAQGAGKADDTTLGIGSKQNTVPDNWEADAAWKLGVADEASSNQPSQTSDTKVNSDGTAVKASTSTNLKTASTRTISVKDPDPVVVLSAVDQGNEDTIAAAAKIGTTDPLPTAPHIPVNTADEGWMTGMASGYTVASSSNLTYSGRSFDDNCVTVAVPQGQEYLMGHPVEIVYGDNVVVATVTDTGGFAPYGRVLDLGGGVYKALGAPTVSDWGVRTVSYRFL